VITSAKALLSVILLSGLLWNYVSPGLRTPPVPPTPTPGYQAAVLAVNPLLYWRLGEVNGAATANNIGSAGSVQNAVYNVGNVTCGVTGLLTDSYDLGATACDALGSAAGIGNSTVATSLPTSLTAFTFAEWFKPTTGGACLSGIGYSNFFSLGNSDDDWFLGCFSTNWEVYLSGSLQQTQAFGPTIGQVYFVVETWDGTDLRFYVNGVVQNTTPFSGPLTISYNTGYGAYLATDDSNEDAVGIFQELFFIGGTALTAGQISTLYAAGT
jgi:Concanavalin A-like lectin/glucanases superfamily